MKITGEETFLRKWYLCSVKGTFNNYAKRREIGHTSVSMTRRCLCGLNAHGHRRVPTSIIQSCCCQPDAMPGELRRLTISGQSGGQIRQSVVNYMIEYRLSSFNDQEGFKLSVDRDILMLRKYMDMIRRITTFGDHLTLQAISEFFFVRIHVVSSPGKIFQPLQLVTFLVEMENSTEVDFADGDKRIRVETGVPKTANLGVLGET